MQIKTKRNKFKKYKFYPKFEINSLFYQESSKLGGFLTRQALLICKPQKVPMDHLQIKPQKR